MGMVTKASQVSAVNRRMPSPSAPSTMARGPSSLQLSRLDGASMVVPTTNTPASFNSRMVLARLVTAIKGMVSAAPLATFRTVAFNPTALSLGAITACTPMASATRKHAPRLCGSSTPSNIRKNGGSSKSDSKISCMSLYGIGVSTTRAITP